MIWIGKLVSNNKISIQTSSKERDSGPLFLFQSSPQVKDLNDSHMAFPRILIGPLYHPSAFNASNYQEKRVIMSDTRTTTFTTILWICHFYFITHDLSCEQVVANVVVVAFS